MVITMNLHALRIFTKVADLGSITAAANDLLLSQPAVTIQIRNLEKELGLKLTESKGRGIQLTEEGRFVYEQGLRLFHLEAQIEDKLKLFVAKEEKIHIATSYIPINYVLPEYIANYKLMNPNVEFFVSLGNVKSVEDKVRHYEADFGFVVQSNIGHEELYFEKLMEVEFVFVAHPSHPLANQIVSLSALSQEELIYREKGSSTRDLLEAIFYAQNSPLPKIGLQMQGLFESLKAVEAGYGIVLAPLLSVTNSIETNRLAPIFIKNVEIKQSLFICTRKSELTNPKFVSYLQEHFILK